MTALTISQHSNYNGFPKAAELIEIQGTHALEASDRALFNHLLHGAERAVEMIEGIFVFESRSSRQREAHYSKIGSNTVIYARSGCQ
jgi:hypothetical protein